MNNIVCFPTQERYEVSASVGCYTVNQVIGAERIPVATYSSLTELAFFTEDCILHGIDVIWDEPTRRAISGTEEPEGAA